MTALKPIENRRVRGVAAESYPSNRICAHPECSEPVTLRPSGEPTVHHIFPRSLTKSKSYFVEITSDRLRDIVGGEKPLPQGASVEQVVTIVPHAVGLCGSGTTLHHGDVEEHRAWIKLEDGVYVWYDRGVEAVDGDEGDLVDYWSKIGPLNPQPGSTEGKPKRKRTIKGTQERAERQVIAVRLPEGFGGDEWDELLEAVESHLLGLDDSPFKDDGAKSSIGKVVVYGLQSLLGWAG